MRRRNLLLLSVLFVLFSACSATGPTFSGLNTPANDNEAIVYIYRPDRFQLGGATPNVDVNGEFIFPLKNNGFNLVRLSPGSHTFELTTSPTWDSYFSPELMPTELRVKGGEIYFLKLDFDAAGFSSSNVNAVGYEGHVRLSEVDARTARSEMAGTKLSE
jgi:hypothetical protein